MSLSLLIATNDWNKDMLIVFASNAYNHYQKALAEEIQKLPNIEYRFIASEPLEEERIQLGFSADANNEAIVVRRYEDALAAESLVNQCDVLICNWTDEEYINRVKNTDKKLIIYTERILKVNFPGVASQIKNFLRTIKYKSIVNKIGKNRAEVLCIGKYCIDDHIKFGIPEKNLHLFGYFAEPSKNDVENRQYKRDGIVRFLWVGRLLDWKLPENALEAIKILKEENLPKYELRVVGSGPQENLLREYCRVHQLVDVVTFVGSKSAEDVRKEMYEADVFLFTSGYGEGWGLTLNEAMCEGMACIAADGAGATTCLAKAEENALVYHSSDVSELTNHMRRMIVEDNLIETIGQKAAEQMKRSWNPKSGAEQLLKIVSQ